MEYGIFSGHGLETEEVVAEINGKIAIAHDGFYRKVPQSHWRLGEVEKIPKTTGIYYVVRMQSIIYTSLGNFG